MRGRWCIARTAAHSDVGTLVWTQGAEEEGPHRCCFGKGSLAERGRGQLPMLELWMCGAGAHVDSCRLGLLLAAPVDKGLGHPGGAVVPVQNCRCPGVGARTQVADAVCPQTMPGGLGNTVMGPAMLQRCSVHSAWNGWPYVCMAGHSTCH